MKAVTAIRWPWLQVSRHVGPGLVNACFLTLRKKKGSRVCFPRDAAHEEEGGVAGGDGKAVCSPVRQVLPLSRALGWRSGQMKPDAKAMVGPAGYSAVA